MLIYRVLQLKDKKEHPQKRGLNLLFYRKWNDCRTVILMGPRRVGKSVMLYHTIQQLIEDGVNPRNILYASVDTPLYNGISLEDIQASGWEFSYPKPSLGEWGELWRSFSSASRLYFVPRFASIFHEGSEVNAVHKRQVNLCRPVLELPLRTSTTPHNITPRYAPLHLFAPIAESAP